MSSRLHSLYTPCDISALYYRVEPALLTLGMLIGVPVGACNGVLSQIRGVRPSDIRSKSHSLMLRAGLMRQQASSPGSCQETARPCPCPSRPPAPSRSLAFFSSSPPAHCCTADTPSRHALQSGSRRCLQQCLHLTTMRVSKWERQWPHQKSQKRFVGG